MTIDKRTDPVEIIARVGDFTSHERALKEWIRMATEAGWRVRPVNEFPLEAEAGDCAVVEVEGLKYLIHLTPHVRMTLIDDAEGSVAQRTVFSHAAWAEPIIEKDGYIPFFGSATPPEKRKGH